MLLLKKSKTNKNFTLINKEILLMKYIITAKDLRTKIMIN